MAYNEWDDPTTPIPNLDEMKYELAAKNPINLVKKAIENMPGSALSQAALSMGSDMLGQVAGIPYGIYQSIKEGKYGTQEGVRRAQELAEPVAQAFHYTPASQGGQDYLEAVNKALEVSKLPPYLGHQAPMRVSPSDVQVLGARGISAAREIGDIPRDFQAAQSGLTRQNIYGEPTYGARLQGVAEDIGDVMARQQARRSEYSSPLTGSVQVFGDLFPDTAMYAVRPNKSGTSIVREVPTPLNPAYSISGESRLSEDLADIVDRHAPRTKDEKSYQRLNQFTNMVPEGFNQSAQDMFRDFILPRMAVEFPGTLPEDFTRAVQAKYGDNANEWYKKQLEAFTQLPEVEAHNKAAFQMAMSDPDIPDPFEFLRDTLIIPPSAEFAGKKAADEWVMNNLQNYLVEHLGTPGDPALKLIAETGRTGIEQDKLQQLIGNRRIEDQAKDIRRKAGMPVEGTYEAEMNRTFDLLGQNNTVIQLLQDKENELVNANPGVRPQEIPGWKEARKEVVQATKRKDETAAKLEKLRMAQAIENYNDTQFNQYKEQHFVEDLEPYFKERFPMFPTGKEDVFQMRVPSQFRDLAREVRNRLAISGAPGIKNIVKPEDVGSYSVPKAVQIRAEMMANKEKMAEKIAKANEEKLMRHTKARMEAMPQEGTYGPVTVVRVDKTLGPDQIKSDLSDITYWMDHCIGRGGAPDKKTLSPFALMLGVENVSSQGKWRNNQPSVLSHLGNRVPQGSSGATTSYMGGVAKGDNEVIDFRDTATGIPFATLNLKVSSTPGKYRFGEFYGYQDGAINGPMVPGRGREYTPQEIQSYRQGIADWANSKAQWLEPASNDYLIDYGDIYDLMSDDHQSVLARQLGVKNIEKREMVHSMGKRFVTEQEAKELWNAAKSAPQEDVGDLVGRREELEIELREAEDPDSSYGPEAIDDLRSRIDDLNQRIAIMENRPPAGAAEQSQLSTVQHPTGRVASSTTIANRIIPADLPILRGDVAAAITSEVMHYQTLNTRQLQRIIQQLQQDPHTLNGPIEQYLTNDNQRETIADHLINVANNRISEIERPQAAQLPATNFQQILSEFNGDLNDTQVEQRINQILENPTITTANLRSLLSDMENQNHPQFQWTDADLYDTLHQRVYDAIQNRPQAAQLPAIPGRQGAENVAQPVRDALNALPTLGDNAFVRDIVARQVIDLSSQVNFAQRPDDFVQQLRNRAQMLEENPPTQETNADDNTEAARQMRLLANSLNTRVVTEPMRVNDPYVTVRNAHQHLINAGDVEGMEAIARNIMENRNGPYGQLNDTQRIRLRRDLYNAIDRTLADREITPLEDIVAMDMNRTRDHYGEEVEQRVDNVLTAINDNYDIQQDPALFIERVRQNADVAIRNNDPNVGEALTNLADVLTQTLRENTQIQSARNRVDVQENNEPVQPAFTDEQISDITSDYLNNLDDNHPDAIRQEAQDMRNGMTDLPQFRDLTEAQANDVRNQIANAMEAYADMSEDMEPPEDPGLALPVPAPERTPEQNAMNEALHHPRWWMNRYPDIPRNIIYDILGRVRTVEDLQGIRVNARNRTRGTIFTGLHGRSRDQAVAMIDDIGNNYQNELQRIDNQVEGPQNLVDAYNAFISEIENGIEEDLFDPNDYTDEDLARMVLDRQIGGEVDNIQSDELRRRLAQEIREHGFDPMHEPQGSYDNSIDAYRGIMDANNDFRDEDGLNTLRALPQLLRRENLYQHFGIENLTQPQRDDLIRHFQILAEDRARQLPPPEGHKKGGYIRKKMNEGGKISPTVPSQSVNDQSKPVEPVKRIHNPDAPEFKDLFIRERAIRGGATQAGGPSADIKQIMNPRNITYKHGGDVSIDAMRYELLRKQ